MFSTVIAYNINILTIYIINILYNVFIMYSLLSEFYGIVKAGRNIAIGVVKITVLR